MRIPNNMPILGVNFKIERLEVADSVITLTRRMGKKTLIKDENGNEIDCNLQCSKSVCDGSCGDSITLEDKTSGEVIIMYIC